MVDVDGPELLQRYVVHVLDVPVVLEDADGSSTTFALVVLRRQTGALLAIPPGVLSPAVLSAGLQMPSEDQIGMSVQISVQAGRLEEFGRRDPPVPVPEAMLEVLLVDVPTSFIEGLVPFADTVVDMDLIHAFNFDDPSLVPLPEDLVRGTWDWIRDPASSVLVTYYSAEEAEVVPETPTQSPTTRRQQRQRHPQPNGGAGAKAAAVPKRATVASLATSLEQVSNTLPAMMDQLERLTKRQDQMEAHLQREGSRPSALKQPLAPSTTTGFPTASTAPRDLIREFPPPRGSTMTGGLPSVPPASLGQDATMLEAERMVDSESSDLAKADQPCYPAGECRSDWGPHQQLFIPFVEGRLAGASAAERFFYLGDPINVKADATCLTSGPQWVPEVVPTAYVKRFGGYGRSRDLGCPQWQVMMLLDHLQQDNLQAARDSAALLVVCLEQAAMDNGRLDVAMLLSLSEDPPAGVFQTKAVTTYAKGRAFAPLAEQKWVTIALAYIKEMDPIASKRLDASGQRPAKDDPPPNPSPNPKKQPKKGAKGPESRSSRVKTSKRRGSPPPEGICCFEPWVLILFNFACACSYAEMDFCYKDIFQFPSCTFLSHPAQGCYS